MTGEFRVGVAGCGKIANDRHIPALQSIPHIEVEAVYDHRWENAERTSKVQDITNPHDDIDEFVAEDLDFITVCTPPFSHADVAETAMNAGISVLTEKPMAVSLKDAERMLQTANNTGETLGVVHNFLYSSSVRKAKRLVRSGKVGDIKYVKGFQLSSPSRDLPSWYADLPGGLFFDESPHLFYLMEEFMGSMSVSGAELQRANSPKQLDSVTAHYQGDNGVVGQLSMMFDAPLSEWFLVIVGTDQVLVVDIFRDILIRFGSDRSHSPVDVVRTAVSGMTQLSYGMATSAISTLQGDLFFGFDRLANQFAQSIKTETEPPVTGDEGREVLEQIHDTLNAGNLDRKDSR